MLQRPFRGTMSVAICADVLEGFETNDLTFDPVFHVTHFLGRKAPQSGDLWMTRDTVQPLLLMSTELWQFLEEYSHPGAYGDAGVGYKTLTSFQTTIIRKLAVDVESLQGVRWNGSTYDETVSYFTLPYGTCVNVGEYPLTPYKNVMDDYGFYHGQQFTKWRTQKNATFYGVHFLSRDETRFVLIPSVAVQNACGVQRHLNPSRTPAEERCASRMVSHLRQLGSHARDVHTEHHGIVIMNKTPEEFVRELQTRAFSTFVKDFELTRWTESYVATYAT
jgi:hypothetical protein